MVTSTAPAAPAINSTPVRKIPVEQDRNEEAGHFCIYNGRNVWNRLETVTEDSNNTDRAARVGAGRMGRARTGTSSRRQSLFWSSKAAMRGSLLWSPLRRICSFLPVLDLPLLLRGDIGMT